MVIEKKSNFHFSAVVCQLKTNALSFCRSKTILDHPNSNCFGWLQIVLVESILFRSGPNHFCHVQVRLLQTNFYNLDLIKMIWTRPKRIGPNLNDWYLTKMVWTVQNRFEFIKGQVRSFLSCKIYSTM